MRHPELFYDWPSFAFAMRRSCLYILGAGASRPQIGGNIGEQLAQLVENLGIYEGYRQEPSPLVTHILPFKLKHELDAMRAGGISLNELIAHTPNEVIELFLARLLTVPESIATPQSAMFARLPPSVLFNFNNDNLAEHVDPRHIVLRPHGTVVASVVHSEWAERALYHLAVPAGIIASFDYHRPLREPNDITVRRAYQLLPYYFENRAMVVTVGYSFGAQPDGSLDDSESFDMLVDLLRWRPKPVLVIDPEPDALAARLEAPLRRRVSVLRCKWNVLCEFVISGLFANAYRELQHRDPRAITDRYRAFEEWR
jgi:hypothetical protein